MQIVNGTPYLEEIKQLMIEYTNALDRDLSFQSFDKELNHLKLKYTQPNGELLAARCEDGTIAGCVAYYKHSDERCEMKRLYVKPEYRKLHFGDTLVKEIISHAKKAGYREMVLDTILPLQSAIYLYKQHGFIECPPYYHNPMPDVIYMKLELQN